MTALIRKDYYVLKKQLWLYVMIILGFQAIPGDSRVFITVLYAALLPASAFAYDDRSRWWELVAMLPYSEWDIVLSRYLMGLGSILLFTVAGAVGRMAYTLIFHQTANFPGLLAQFALGACFLSLSLPIYFRFDAERSRLVRMVLVILICGITGGLSALITSGWARDARLSGLFSLPSTPIALTAILLTAASIYLSRLAYRARQK